MSSKVNLVAVKLGDHIITVDEETAASLQDPTVAAGYLMCIKGKSHVTASAPTDESSVWKSSKRPTRQDHEATLALLSLRRQYKDKFDDKKHVKLDLWLAIGKELNQLGYNVGPGIQGREKTRQKFSNLQSSYIKYHEKMRTTGEGKIKLPPYYDELEEILGDKHKVKPLMIIDTLQTSKADRNVTSNENVCPSTSTSGDSDATSWEAFSSGITVETKNQCHQHKKIKSAPSISSAINKSTVKDEEVATSLETTCVGNTTAETKNRFQHLHKKIKPGPPRSAALQELVAIQRENQKIKKDNFQSMMHLLQTQNQQRHEEIMALLSTKPKKVSRKRKISTDEDDSSE